MNAVMINEVYYKVEEFSCEGLEEGGEVQLTDDAEVVNQHQHGPDRVKSYLFVIDTIDVSICERV